MKNSILSRRIAPAIAMLCLCAVKVQAATFTVSNTLDTGAGSLRQAVTDALAAAGPHDIQAGGVTGTISLQSALPVITNRTITIHGPTSGTLTVTRGVAANFRIFTVNNSGGAASLTINRLTMTNGNPGTASTDTGGGILCLDATVNLSFCTISGCSSGGNGGGIHYDGATASSGTIDFCTFTGNTAAGAGGGIASSSASTGTLTLNLTNSTLSGNTASTAAGGGLTLVRSTGNVRNCTISGNTTGSNGGGVNVGSTVSTLNATNCTITNNTAPAGIAGGIRSTGTGGSTVNLINTLVVGNTITGGAAEDTNWGTGVKSAKNSVVGVHAGTAYGTTTASQIGILASPKVVNLGALASNGGVTQTHALLATSPELAINLGSDSDAATMASDQRGVGYNRRAGSAVDIGAVESGVTAPAFTGVTLLGTPASATASNTLTFTVPPGTNRLLLVEASHADSTGLNFTSVTFGASALTLAGIKTDTSTAVDTFWQLPLGTSTNATTATITVTPPAGQEAAHFIAALAFQNVDQTTPTSGFTSTNNIGAGTNPTVNVPSAVGDLVIDIDDLWTTSTTTPITRTPGSGQAVAVLANSPITNPPSSYVGIGCYSISLEPGATSTTMNWTANYDAMIHAGLNIKQAAALSNNADLSALALTTATINEAFAANTISYTSSVPNATSSVTVTPTRAQANATIQARVAANAFAAVTSGSPSASLPLAVGANTIQVQVTAQDGTTIKTYSIVVTRAAAPAITGTMMFTQNTGLSDGIAQDGEAGSTDIAGITMQVINITDTAGTFLASMSWQNNTWLASGDPSYSALTYAQNAGCKGMAIRSSDGSEFQLNQFLYYNWGETTSTTITVKGYRNAVEVASTTFAGYVNTAFMPITVNLDSTFDNVDDVRLYISAGGYLGNQSATNHSINNIVIAPPVAAPVTAPTVTTAAQSAVTATSATLGGNVTADGGATVSERGIVWKTSTGPTTADTKVANGSGTGTFSATVGSLPAGTTVFVRAYATNNVNTSYGNEISFTTPALPVAISSLNRVNATPTNAGTVNWTLTFASAVTGVTASNFSLTGTAAAGSAVGTPTTSNAGLTWNVPVTTGSTDGPLTLRLANATGLSSAISTALPFDGQSYDMDKTPPQIVSINRLTPTGQTTNLTSLTFRVTYSEAVTLNAPATSRFAIVPINGGTVVGTVQSVTGSGNTRDVTVNITSGSGEFRLRGVD